MSDVRVESVAGLVRITFDAPHRLNAFTAQMYRATTDAVHSAAGNGDVVLIAGAGRAFSAGAAIVDGADPAADLAAGNTMIRAILECPSPVVCAVGGIAAGIACALVAAADISVATRSATFHFAFRDLGLLPDGGLTALLAASVGRARALGWALTGAAVPANEAAAAGLVLACVPDAEFRGNVNALVTGLVCGPSAALAATKKAFNNVARDTLPAVLDREFGLQTSLLAGPDWAIGRAAFLAKRAPDFTA